MKLSTRYLLPIFALALVSVAVVWPRWLRPQRVDPCLHPDVLEVTGLIQGSQPEGELRERRSADNIEWSQGRIPDASFPRDPLVFRIVRSYSVLKTAERPVMFMPFRVEPETTRLELVDAPGGPLPVHVVRTTGREDFSVVAYFYAFGNDPVTHPFLVQLAGALRELRYGRRPLTVFLAGGTATPDSVDHREELALHWLQAAWEHYRGMCVERRPTAAPVGAGEPR